MTDDQKIELARFGSGSMGGIFLRQAHRDLALKARDYIDDLEDKLEHTEAALKASEARERNSNKSYQELMNKHKESQQWLSRIQQEREEISEVNDKLRDEIADLADKLGQLGEEYNKSQEAAIKLQSDYDAAALRAVTAEGELAEYKDMLTQAQSTEQELQKVSIDFVTLQGQMTELFANVQEVVQHSVREAVINSFLSATKDFEK